MGYKVDVYEMDGGEERSFSFLVYQDQGLSW